MRSQPGLGRIIGIHTLGPKMVDGSDVPGEFVWWMSRGEDYADSLNPLHVKYSADIDAATIARRLRELADLIERHDWHITIDPDRTTIGGGA